MGMDRDTPHKGHCQDQGMGSRGGRSVSSNAVPYLAMQEGSLEHSGGVVSRNEALKTCSEKAAAHSVDCDGDDIPHRQGQSFVNECDRCQKLFGEHAAEQEMQADNS